ncbi:MAG: hypothetical protein QXP81_11200 [Nitrososphaerota archaeon]
MILEAIYGFGEIPPNTLNVRFSFTLTPQPARILEVHAHGAPSTNFDVAIFQREDYDPLHKVYEWIAGNLEFHDIIYPAIALIHNEKRYIYFLVSNNDSANPCRLRVRLVYEPAEAGRA